MRRWILLLAILVTLLLVSATVWAPDEPQMTVVINEICWAGAAHDPTAEWIELVNTTESAIDLTGWQLVSSDGAPDIRLRGMIQPRMEGDPQAGYFLLERDSDDSVPDVAADLLYQGALTNLGETLFLISPDGRVADTANALLPDEDNPSWPAGSDGRGASPFASMERIRFNLADEPGNWASCALPSTEGAEGFSCSTPGFENSVYNILPVARISITPPIPHPGLPAEFSAVDSTDFNDPIESYHWDFGDGTEATDPTVTHTYVAAGDYELILTLTDSKGGISQMIQTVSVALTTPPLADFSLVLKPGENVARAGDVITFQDESSDTDSQIVSWKWHFGDGDEASDRNVSHVYADYGDVVVGLRVTDTQGEVGIQTRSMTIASQRPVTVFTLSAEQPNQYESVTFDASESFDPDGIIVSYLWDFDGDGTVDLEGPDATADYAYESAGSFEAFVSVIDDQSETSTRSRSVVVNAAPVVQFQISDFEPDELESVLFTDLSIDTDGTIVSWLWEFGDGETSEENLPEHVYQTSGTVVVSLSVTDQLGATGTADATIHIGNLPPVADLSIPQTTLATGARFSFDASGSVDPSPQGGIELYEWSLDGGATFDIETSTPTRSHIFQDDGRYAIRVRITDSAGAIAISESVDIIVTNRPPTISQITRDPAEQLLDGDEATFTAHASDADGEIVGWTWNVDSGDTGTTEAFSTVFEDDGSYLVSLRVRDDDGATSDTYTVTVPVINAPPIADFSAVQGMACGVSSVHFDASASYDPSPTGRIVHVAWDFGDGTYCPGSTAGCTDSERWTPQHCYSEPGTYIVTLVVIDEHGAMSSTEKSILIAE